jgi:uncharacterized protein with von Willebrand factor type A (vWA) domain
LKTLWVFLFCISFGAKGQELPAYKPSENTGLGKVERIDNIEKFIPKIIKSIHNNKKSMKTSLEKELGPLKKEMKMLKSKELKEIINRMEKQDREIRTLKKSIGQKEKWEEVQGEVKFLRDLVQTQKKEMKGLNIVIQSLQEILLRIERENAERVKALQNQ